MISWFFRHFLIRLLISFLLVGAIFYIFFLQPRQAVDGTISNHVKDVQAFDQSLQLARERLKDLESPASVKVGARGARDYANKLNEAKGAFSADQPKIPAPIKNDPKNDKVKSFNSVILDPNYRKAIVEAGFDLKADQAFLTHQAATMLALANLLEYNPAADLSLTNPEAITEHLNAAQGGLQTTVDRLAAVPEYQNDTLLTELNDLVNQAQTARDQLSGQISQPQYVVQKQEFIKKIADVQSGIIKNRAQFWSNESPKLFKITDAAQKKPIFLPGYINPYSIITEPKRGFVQHPR